MQNLKLLIICVLLTGSFSARAQNVKPAFASFLYITYDYDEATKKADIREIMEISSNGLLHLLDKLPNGIIETNYPLADTSIAKLNKFFNGKKPLKSYMVTDHIDPRFHRANPLEYISYTDLKGNTYPFTLVNEFMAQGFRDAVNQLWKMPSKIAYKGRTLNTPALLKQILDTQKKAGYVPKIEDPPPMM
ncbi:hypothetical protein [Mucilaginibacter gilvus]|uniref:Uncharacterized protein n=1 Tax=Mucilaginibacter gilvus TaxID=2305909 RepID=A0A444MHP0_9SPHI|nr:hypothetical protein [Mucilaginibacter gilvus]RWY46254.1 hypothetical protein EPL05_23195 [Mucilaginibacter gilvus]